MKNIFILIFILMGSLATAQSPVKKSDILVQGHSKTLQGTSFWYHSAIPDIHDALLVRALDGTQVAEWETEIPKIKNGDEYVNFVWQAGLGSNMGSVRMDRLSS